MAVRDDLGTRMKEFYEQVPKTRLVSLSTALRWIFFAWDIPKTYFL